ncbi:hypothetical protein ACT6QH_04225 [Xanthobacter sp. TB0139]|uniref:hypothetical protein n=1 Tax=Xanthobacter sp. TB0139 TaxID=3459178 RepID=UPI00403991BE
MDSESIFDAPILQTGTLMKSHAPLTPHHRGISSSGHAPQGVVRPLAGVGFIVGAVLGYSAAKAYAPGAELIALCYTGLIMALATTALWSLLARMPGKGGNYLILNGALAMAFSVPIATFFGTIAVISTLDPNSLYNRFGAIVELAGFMVKFIVLHAGFISLPTAAVAGAATVRWRTYARPS